MNYRATRLTVLLLAYALCAIGCSTARVIDPPIVLEIHPPIAIDIETFAGDVILRADPSLTDTKVRLVRRATHGLGRRKEAKASLEQIQLTAEVVVGDLGPLLQVRATTTHPEPHFQRTDIYIDAPEILGMFVRTRNGRVVGKNVTGPIDITTSYEYVRILSNYAITDPVTILNTEGDIDYRVRGGSTGRFDCVAIGGRASIKARYGEVVIYPETNDDTVRADLNNGNNDVILRTVGGNIRVAVVGNPTEVGLIIVH